MNREALGPSYGIQIDTHRSPLQLFIGDEAAEVTSGSEVSLEKSTTSRGVLTVHPNEADLYGFVGELENIKKIFLTNEDAFLNWEYGLETTFFVRLLICLLNMKLLWISLIQTSKKNYMNIVHLFRREEGECLCRFINIMQDIFLLTFVSSYFLIKFTGKDHRLFLKIFEGISIAKEVQDVTNCTCFTLVHFCKTALIASNSSNFLILNIEELRKESAGTRNLSHIEFAVFTFWAFPVFMMHICWFCYSV